jgi:hypothetical protein
MFYVGLDIHSKRISRCVLSGMGQLSIRFGVSDRRAHMTQTT